MCGGTHPAGGSANVWCAGERRGPAHGGTEPADLQGLEAKGWSEGSFAGKDIRLADVPDELTR